MSRIAYQDDLVTLIHGDALEILPTLERGTVSTVLTDPPYIIGAVSAGTMASKSGGWADMMNSSMWFSAWYRECDRLLHRKGSMWTFANWRTVPVIMRAALDAGLPITSMMVWDKEWIGPGGQQGLRPSYELCALMAQPDFAIPNRGIADVMRHKVGGYKEHGHPAEKPVGLMRRILEAAAAEPGSVVLDPFAGSGTVAVAARALGLRCISIEAEEKWCDVAISRLNNLEMTMAA